METKFVCEKIYSRIASTGSFLPEKIVSNDELAAKLAERGVETSDEWIRTRTGIEQRYFAEGAGSTTAMAFEAAKRALENGGFTPDEIDLIIVATTTPDSVFPSTACQVQALLQASSAGAFDIQAVCSGFVYALSIADSMIRAGSAERVLVIGSESLSRVLDWDDRTTCVLFGDGAGAAVLEKSSEPGILATELKADGTRGVHVLAADSHIDNGKIVGDPYIRMEGRLVFKAAVEKMTESALNVLAAANLAPSDVDVYIPHQANLRIMNMVRGKLNIPESNLVVSVTKHGNTSAASVPLALDKARQSGQLKRGDIVLLQGVGGGFTWASALLKF